MEEPTYKTVAVVIDDSAIDALDVWEIIDPVWWTAEFWKGEDAYEKSVEAFSDSQRMMLALCVYLSDVKNGGYELYLSSAFGDLWPDALAALEELGLPEGCKLLQGALDELESGRSTNHVERESEIETGSIDFSKHDAKFRRFLTDYHVEQRMTSYVRANRSEFYFSGNIRRIGDGSASSNIR